MLVNYRFFTLNSKCLFRTELGEAMSQDAGTVLLSWIFQEKSTIQSYVGQCYKHHLY